jgi:hypothetical protein
MIDIAEPGSTMHPRTKFRQDLLNFVLKLQREGHDNILMGDFNEVYGSDPDGSSKFATFAGGRTRIDCEYVFMSPKPAAAVANCGYESPSFRFQVDHRGFFVDFVTDQLFGNVAPVLAAPASRNLVSCDRQNCARYIAAKYKYLYEHIWFRRLEALTHGPSGRQPVLVADP